MKNLTHSTLNSALALGLFALSSAAVADLPEKFDYTKASTNYVDNTNSAGSGAGGFDDLANKMYFGGAIGPSEADSYCDGASSCEDKDTAWKVFGGYKVTDRLSAEAAYINLGDIHKPTNGGGSETSQVSALTATGVASMPINDQVDLFGKLGIMRWSSDNSVGGDESGFGMTYGLGAKMNISEKTKLRAEWEKLPGIETSSSGKTDVNMLSIGVELSTY
ncbi:MAG: outer membrane beta-barrel protein [Cocleimonas sp.]